MLTHLVSASKQPVNPELHALSLLFTCLLFVFYSKSYWLHGLGIIKLNGPHSVIYNFHVSHKMTNQELYFLWISFQKMFLSIIWQAKWVSNIQLNVVKIHGSDLSDTWNQWSQECLTPQITVWVHNTYGIFTNLIFLCIDINSLWNYKHRHINYF